MALSVVCAWPQVEIPTHFFLHSFSAGNSFHKICSAASVSASLAVVTTFEICDNGFHLLLHFRSWNLWQFCRMHGNWKVTNKTLGITAVVCTTQFAMEIMLNIKFCQLAFVLAEVDLTVEVKMIGVELSKFKQIRNYLNRVMFCMFFCNLHKKHPH